MVHSQPPSHRTLETAMTFDTLTAARELESAKFSREQAEAIAKTVRDGQGELATKADVAALENSTKAGIAALGHSTNANIAALENSMNTSIAALKANIAALENSMNASIATLENSTNANTAALENSMNTSIAALEIRLVKWAIGLAFAVAAIVLAGVRLMLDTGA